jgi:NTE family protein
MPDRTGNASRTIASQGLSQVAFVFQGGGALGAYQGGVFEALDEAGIVPTWVIGTSIGAINAALIAGNAPADRLERLKEFWRRIARSGPLDLATGFLGYSAQLRNAWTMLAGVPGFFTPNPVAQASHPFLPSRAMTPQTAGYYSTAPLERTLADLIDLDRLAARELRLTVGAANLRTAEMHYFDSHHQPLDLRHVMASGALPPAFPAVEIDGELFWDGGVISNTPVEVIFDEEPRRSSLVFSVHLWRPEGGDPDTMVKVLARTKDLQYASRTLTHIRRQKQIHRMRHVVRELVQKLPADVRETPDARHLASFACETRMHVVRLVAPPLAGEDHSKDIDFSEAGIRQRWAAGLEDTRRVIEAQPWLHEVDPLEGFILHDTDGGDVVGHS